jgi:hypothetical protein
MSPWLDSNTDDNENVVIALLIKAWQAVAADWEVRESVLEFIMAGSVSYYPLIRTMFHGRFDIYPQTRHTAESLSLVVQRSNGSCNHHALANFCRTHSPVPITTFKPRHCPRHHYGPPCRVVVVTPPPGQQPRFVSCCPAAKHIQLRYHLALE